MKVLFLGKRFYTNRDALADRYGRIYQLPMHWSRQGEEVDLWLVDYHGRNPAQAIDGAMRVASTPFRDMDFARHLRRAWRRNGNENPDVVVASGDCYVGLLGYRLARHHRARFVFDVYDKYDEFVSYVRLPGFDLFRFLLGKADACLFASRGLMRQLVDECATSRCVPNGIDTERFDEQDKSASRDALGLPQDAVLLGYFGSMESDRGVDDLIAAVQLLREEGMPAELLIGGKARPGLDLHRPGVRYLGDVPYARVVQALASCDALALPYRQSPFMDMGASCKIAEYMAVRRPIVATRTPNLVENFPAQAAVLADLLAEPSNPSSLAHAIRAQLAQSRLVDLPEGMTWEAIAAAALPLLVGLSGQG